MLKTRLKIILSSVFIFSALLSMPAVAGPQEDETTQQLIARSEAPAVPGELPSARIVITDASGVHVVTATDASVTLGNFLNAEGYEPKTLRTEDNLLVDRKALVPMGETLFLFKIEYRGTQKKTSIPFPTTKVETTALLTGETEIKQEGMPGQGLITTVKETNLATNAKANEKAKKARNVSYEMFTVVKPPQPEILLVGLGSEEDSLFPRATTTCSNSSTVPSTVDINIVNIHEEVCKIFPEISVYGTYRAYCTYTCDHKDGIAVDIMVSGERGRQVADYLVRNYEKFNINNMIYEQQIWAVYRPVWTKMDDRGSLTANHFDHVHVSVFPSTQEDVPEKQ